jgi:hypothetical protein
MSSINKIHTPCKSCVFAIYSESTQTGCALDYIEKYKNKDIEILEVYDEDKEFYVINNKKCIGYRENKWFAKYDLEHSSLETKIAKFNELNHIEYLMVVDLKDFDLDGLEVLKDGVSKLIHKPHKIIFIRYQNDKRFPYDRIKEFFESTSINCKWRIQTMVDNSLSHKDILHNITNLNKGYRFIVDINKPTNNISPLVEKANNIVYKDLDSVLALKNQDASAILFSAPSYRWSIIVEKVDILDTEENYIVV